MKKYLYVSQADIYYGVEPDLEIDAYQLTTQRQFSKMYALTIRITVPDDTELEKYHNAFHKLYYCINDKKPLRDFNPQILIRNYMTNKLVYQKELTERFLNDKDFNLRDFLYHPSEYGYQKMYVTYDKIKEKK